MNTDASIARKIGVCALIILSWFPVRSQLQHQVSTAFSINRLDFWHEFLYGIGKNKWQTQVGTGYGINRTWFQGRLFPKLSVGGTYFWLDREKFELGPHVQYNFCHLKYSKSDRAAVNWHDGVVGVRWNYGQRWKIGQTIGIGYFVERYYSTIYDRKMSAGNWMYYANLSVSYAF